MQTRKFVQLIGVTLVAALLLTGCSSGPAATKDSSGAPKAASDVSGVIRIAVQNGLTYAPLTLMAGERLIENKYPKVTVKWVTISSAGSVMDALISGAVDVGAIGAPALLIAWQKGVPVKIAGGLGQIPLEVVTMDPAVKKLGDLLKSNRTVSMVGVGTTQDLLLKALGKKELGSASALEKHTVMMPNPDASAALQIGQISARVSQPPWLFDEVDKGARVIATGNSVFTQHFNYTDAVASQAFHDKTKLYNAFVDALQQATDSINHDREGAAAILAKANGGTKASFVTQLKDPRVVFTTTPTGSMQFAKLMADLGILTKVPKNWKDLVWPNLYGRAGS